MFQDVLYYNKYWNNQLSKNGHAKNHPNWNLNELEKLYNFSKKFLIGSILDFGAGEGVVSQYIQNKGYHVKAVDISERAKEKFKNKKIKIEYKTIKNGKIPYKNNTFNTVIATDVLEHLLDIDQLIKEIFRVLSTKGHLVIVTPEYNLIKRLVIALFFWNKIFYPNNPHIRFFTKKSLSNYLHEFGFKLVDFKWGLTWFRIIPQNMYVIYEKEKD